MSTKDKTASEGAGAVPVAGANDRPIVHLRTRVYDYDMHMVFDVRGELFLVRLDSAHKPHIERLMRRSVGRAWNEAKKLGRVTKVRRIDEDSD